MESRESEAAPRAEGTVRGLLAQYVHEAAQVHPGVAVEPNQTRSGRQLLSAGPDQQKIATRVLIGDLRRRVVGLERDWPVLSALSRLLATLLSRSLPWRDSELVELVEGFTDYPTPAEIPAGLLAKLFEARLDRTGLSKNLTVAIERLAEGFASETNVEWRRSVEQFRNLCAQAQLREPPEWLIAVHTGTPNGPAPPDRSDESKLSGWEPLPASEALAWSALLNHLRNLTGTRPTKSWSKSLERYLNEIPVERFRAAVLSGLRALKSQSPFDRSEEQISLFTGLVWSCLEIADREVVRELSRVAEFAYQKESGRTRSVRIANAAARVLAQIASADSVSELARLKMRVRQRSIRKSIDKALTGAAERLGVPVEEIEERWVPDFGLTEVGLLETEIRGVRTQLKIESSRRVDWIWFLRGAEFQTPIPRWIRESAPAEILALREARKQILSSLSAQRSRLEQFMVTPKVWKLPDWRRYYLDHPLVGTLARRLIWRFTTPDGATTGIYHQGELRNREGRVIRLPEAETAVELWHPIDERPEATLEWRHFLEDHDILQPFKQAHREIYRVTEAERRSGHYSMRFASHILKQYQLNALCQTRGWRYAMRGIWDGEETTQARLELPAWNLAVECDFDAIDAETSDIGLLLYLSTDRVRFLRLRGQREGRPLELTTIPPRVFSEAMRDVDLFVGVSSIGNDAEWRDRETRYRQYWSSYALGALNLPAKRRREVLERLIPKLRIATRLELKERFLVVKGQLRTYKIHLGSSNILMSPDDEYLCIVQGPREPGDSVALPFEGDTVLAQILSKALLLARDDQVTDPTITSQIH